MDHWPPFSLSGVCRFTIGPRMAELFVGNRKIKAGA
jgi:hypothetical protein